jgi:cytochrome c oxidase cbb3-type subunit II
MDKLRVTFIGALITLFLSGATLVVAPLLKFGELPPNPNIKPYTEQEKLGRASYISNGCVYCHSQQPRDAALGPDAKRGWGRAATVVDYPYDTPHLLGTMRTGPDLLNIGARQPSEDWHLAHLYQPRAVIKGSTMPAYPFLFKVKDSVYEGDRAISLPPEYEPPNGRKVIATNEALALVAYLKALDRTAPITVTTKDSNGSK